MRRGVFLLLLLGAGAPAGAAPLGPMPAAVVRVIDGDTVKMRVAIWIDQELTVSVRLAGVDAPELFRPACAAEKDRAEAAKAFVDDFLSGGGAMLSNIEQGKYAGRVVASIEAQGRDLGDALIAAGLAAAEAGRDWCAESPVGVAAG